MPKALDLTNKTFGYITCTYPTNSRDSSGSIKWVCMCVCGASITLPSRLLVSGNTKSCGCKKGELIANSVVSSLTTHGASFSYKKGGVRLDYSIWSSMKERCYNRNNPFYKSYGGRGIRVCSTWKLNFETYASYIRSLPNCPKDAVLSTRGGGSVLKKLKLSLDRINNDGDYEPGNVKWSTNFEQSRNKSNNVNYIFRGKKICLKDVSSMVEIPYKKLHQRIKRDGKSLMQAIAMG